MDIAVQAREHLPLLSEQDMNQAYNLMFELLYLNYESTKPYVPQVAHNAERMTQLVDCIKNTKKN